MSSKINKKIVIIGAGVIGASIGYHLSRRIQCDVTILERDRPGAGASGHSFGWVNAFRKDPREYHTLNRRSLDMWYRLERQIDADIGIQSGGEMRWEMDKQRADKLKARIKQLQTWGYPCKLISREEMLDLEPGLSPGNVKAASFSEADIHIDSSIFIDVCLERAHKLGLVVKTGACVTDFVITDNRISAVVTTDSEYPCDVVVLACGVETSTLALKAGVNIPQQQSPGIVIKTSPCPKLLHNAAVIHTPSISESKQNLHLRQMRDGTLRIGQGTQEGINRDDSQKHADSLLANAKEYLPSIGDVQAIPTPIGYRPMPLDGYPVLGFTNVIPNMYIALMHSGVTLAPLVGEMATLEIADEVEVDWFRPYRLDRFK